MINGQRYSATTSSWASPCNSWKDNGYCARGISCFFKHEGFPTHDKDGNQVLRCVVCGRTGHASKDCKAPGGGADPDKEKHWAEYRKRKEEQTSTFMFGHLQPFADR